MNARTKKPAADSTPLADMLRLRAVGHKSGGNDERAAGLMEAADFVDMDAYRLTGASLVEALDLMIRARLDDFVADVVAAVKDTRAPELPQGVDLAPPTLLPRRRPGPPRGDGNPTKRLDALVGLAAAHETPKRRATSTGDGSGPGSGARRVLIAIAQHGAAGVTRSQLTILTGYKKSTRDLYLQKLSQCGYIGRLVLHSDVRITASELGRRWLGTDYAPLPTGAKLLAYWLYELPEGQAAVLSFVVKFFPHTVSSDRISEATGYKKSTRDLYIQKLVGRRLLEKTGKSFVCAAAELFDADDPKRKATA